MAEIQDSLLIRYLNMRAAHLIAPHTQEFGREKAARFIVSSVCLAIFQSTPCYSACIFVLALIEQKCVLGLKGVLMVGKHIYFFT